jgi:hypothetical protein
MPLEDEIEKEYKEIYQRRYGKRNPQTLSTLELEAVTHEAARIVQERRKRGSK